MAELLEQPMTDAQFRREPGHCPFCGHGQIVGDSWVQDGDRATQEESCGNCGGAWLALYKLQGYIITWAPTEGE